MRRGVQSRLRYSPGCTIVMPDCFSLRQHTNTRFKVDSKIQVCTVGGSSSMCARVHPFVAAQFRICMHALMGQGVQCTLKHCNCCVLSSNGPSAGPSAGRWCPDCVSGVLGACYQVCCAARVSQRRPALSSQRLLSLFGRHVQSCLAQCK